MAKAERSTVLNFEKMFQDYVDANQKKWDHDRSSSVGASETFGCLRQVWFKKKGADHGFTEDEDSEKSWGAMERGNIIEDHWVVPVLKATLPDKVTLEYAGGDNQMTFVYGQNSATPDGLYLNLARDALVEYGIPDIESDCILIEVKSIDPRSTLTEEKTIHHGQAQVQMGILNEMTEYKPKYTVILYIDASFFDQISVFVVKFDPNLWKAARRRAKLVYATDFPATIAAEGKLNDGCKFCTFTHACAKVNKEAVPVKEDFSALDKAERDELYALAQDERDADADEKAAAEEKAKIRAKIKEILSGTNSRRYKDDRFSISWTWQAGRTTTDVKAAEADGIDLSKYKTTGDGFEKMTVTVKEFQD